MFGLPPALMTPAAGGGGGADPSFANVSLLLHMDGSNGGTSFPDSGPVGHTVTPSAVETSTAQQKFGSASALFATIAAQNDRLSAPNHTSFDLTSGDFTLEFWHYPTLINNQQILLMKGVTTATFPFQVYITNANKYAFRGFDSSGSFLQFDLSGNTNAVANTWHFIQARRSGNTFSLALNGSQDVSPQTSAGSLRSEAGSVFIGNHSNQGQACIGHMDDVRITKGVARTFALPSAAFPDS